MDESLKNQYKDSFEKIRSILNEWDPYSLIGMGAPPDEYESEVEILLSKAKTIRSASEVEKFLIKSFNSDYIVDPLKMDDLKKVSEELYTVLNSF